MVRHTNDRILIVLLIGLGSLAVLWTRCVWLQLAAAPRYVAMGQAQHYATEILRAQRGTLYDRTGRVLAVSIPAPSVFANARRIAAKGEVAQALSRLVQQDAAMIRRRLQRDKGFVWVARQVDPALAPQLLALREEGVGTLEEMKRFYPQGRLAAHLLGFVDVDSRGLEGLELSLNAVLQGRDGSRLTLRDAKGDRVIGPWTRETQPVDGEDVALTIDSVVQQVVEETLDWGVATYHAKGGSIIVMDPMTGAVLAMATRPSYDPARPASSPADHRRNRTVTDLFEPGSTFKIVTAAALLEEHRITLEETIFCEHGSYQVPGRHTLDDHRPHGTLSFHDVITLSSNIGTAKAAQRLKPQELERYIRAFGFGRPTGIDLPGEVSGMVRPASRWSKLSPFIIPIGQEVAVTPIQLAVMTAVVANGGLWVRPYVVERTTPAAPRRVLSQATAETLQGILVDVVRSGTGRLATVQGLRVAGKTGTAQKLEPSGHYSHSRYVASFVGFGPVPDPRFVIVVCVHEPRPVYFGGVVAAPMFKRIVERLVSYWELDRQLVAKLP